MKNLKIFHFFNFLFFIYLSLIILFNINIFGTIKKDALQKEYQKLCKVVGRNLAEAGSSNKVFSIKYVNPNVNVNRLNDFCDRLFLSYCVTTNWLTEPPNSLAATFINNALKIADVIYANLHSERINPSFKLIRNEVTRVKERNALITIYGREPHVIDYMKKLFEMENFLTKQLLHSMVGKTQSILEAIISNEEEVIDKIKDELLKRRLILPDYHVRRMMYRIVRRAHDIALEEGILSKNIPEPVGCYLEEFSS
ncbi:hypothetical protein PGAL8A_00269200 [Plasmodium gallinaceum]|uniref:Uncharacterized protein n=1 Tax=Plasmodium gallinaceum TaxID=5849 RepID=A0A1J1GTD4_PLAGA|nr:hypothetical protein PGAL8A_00269200 [Plasmodium gallinaceum]CRG95490.1 hypothetical protein PGAL8A_00269200 [Plasmodium gallinaceum]